MNAVESEHTGLSDANDEAKRRKSEEKKNPTAKVGTASSTCVVFFVCVCFYVDLASGGIPSC